MEALAEEAAASAVVVQVDVGNLVLWATAFVELVVIGFGIYKIGSIFKEYRRLKSEKLYFSDTLTQSFQNILGKNFMIRLMASEFMMMYFSIFGWFLKPKYPQNSQILTYYKTSMYIPFFWAFLFVLIIETVALHFIISIWSGIGAWIFTGLSIYTFFWFIGDFNAMRLQPIIFHENRLFIKIALRWSGVVEPENIESVVSTNSQMEDKSSYINLTPIGDPNILITLKEPVIFDGLFGIKKEAKYLGLYLDEPSKFVPLF